VATRGHLAWLATVGVILPTEGDALLLEGQQTMIGNGYAVSVAVKNWIDGEISHPNGVIVIGRLRPL
jgi:hypothetical protein